MSNKAKAKLVTVALFTFIVLLCANVVALWPATLPWILGAFAIPGAWKACRVTYVWLTVDDAKRLAAKNKTYEDYAREGM